MNKKSWISKRFVLLLVGVMFVMSVTIGCGSKKNDMMTDDSYSSSESMVSEQEDSFSNEYLSSNEYSSMEEVPLSDTSKITSSAIGAGRKLIKNVNMSVEIENFDELLVGIQSKVEELGGYIENLNAGSNRNYYGGENLKYANITARIPGERLVEFVHMVDVSSNVMSRSEYLDDVTLKYVDLESHKKMLLVEQDALLTLLEKAETVEDIITIETRLSEVRYQVESMEVQLRTFDNQVNYSTVSLNINEVLHLTPVVEKGSIEKIKTGFSENIFQIGRSTKSFIVDTIIALPYLVLWLIFIVIAIKIIKVFFKKHRGNYKEEKEINAAKKNESKNKNENDNKS